MEERATGLILRHRPLTETSLIVHWLTPAAGRIATVAKGARRPKSPFRGKLDLFFLADFSFNRSRSSDLHTLREVVLRNTHAALRRELGWLQQASYATNLVEIATETETPIPEVFDLMNEWFDYLPEQPSAPHSILAFELKLLNFAGLRPEEAAKTTWAMINFKEGWIRVEAQTSKIRQRRVVYAPPMAMAWL